MNDTFGVVTAPGTVRLERLLPGPIERVWSYLTDSDLRGKWLASGPMELRVGGRVELHFLHASLSPQRDPIPERYREMEQGHSLQGRITRLDPPRLLAYSWGDEAHDSEVAFELAPQGDEVKLVITHQKLQGRDELVSVSSGWHTHVAFLIDQLHNRTSPGFWTRYTKMHAEYAQKLPQ